MMTRLNSIVLLLAIQLLSHAAVQAPDSPPEEVFHVLGEVRLFQADSGAPVKDASKVVVWLTPQGFVQTAHIQTTPSRFRMIQRNKMFEPGLLVVPIGSLVEFPNLDPWFHNVFSLYQGKRFDLGLYEAGAQKTIKFDRPGPSYIFCNIHPEMAAVVLTVDSDLYAISDKSGRESIDRVPEGKYLLHVWYENANPKSLDLLKRTVEVDRNNDALFSISVPVAPQNAAKHKNKYGKDYDPKAGATDY